jgi:hypothetical protein
MHTTDSNPRRHNRTDWDFLVLLASAVVAALLVGIRIGGAL